MTPERRPFESLDGRPCLWASPRVVANRKKVLFICTRNSVRSQIAEALLNTYHCDKYEAFSAGVRQGLVDSRAIDVMAEIGIDISKAQSKSIEEMLDHYFDTVVTVCDDAQEECPLYPGGSELIHKGFEDPASFDGTPEEVIDKFREVRDQIKEWIDQRFGKRQEGDEQTL